MTFNNKSSRVKSAVFGRLFTSLMLCGFALNLTACQGEPSPCEAMKLPPSAVPADQCPVQMVTSQSLYDKISPVTGKQRTDGFRAGTWKLWTNDRNVDACMSCASVCDCKMFWAGSSQCGFGLGNASMPDKIFKSENATACTGVDSRIPGTVRCIQGQCELTPASSDRPAK